MAKSKIATAYVQVIPSAEGIKGKLSNTFSEEGEKAGSTFGSNFIGKVGGLIASAGIGKAFGESLTAGADLQQSLGGIETLFKDSADIVVQNAEQAYKTAGMSANQYMETVTGFSASLLQGTGGDTAEAAAVADMALRDMSDNVNKFGSDMANIQNAYQGFAKQNYTMLDNLKLGYGGTKTEMERLLADAKKLTGVEYDISNLSDVYTAIHVIQEEMGVTGTTALEAATTFSGSMASMKAAGSDLLANLSLGRDIMPSLEALEDAVFTFLEGNLFPMVGNILSGLPSVVSGALNMAIRGMNLAANNADAIVQTGVDLVTGIGAAIISALPYLAEAALNIVTSLGNAILTTDWSQTATDTINGLRSSMDTASGKILGADGNIIQAVLTAITNNLPELLESGVDIVVNIANGILNEIPNFLETAGQLLQQLLTTILGVLPDMLESGASLIEQLADGLLNSLPSILSAGADILAQLVTEIANHLPELLEQGAALIGKLIEGFRTKLPEVLSEGADILAQLVVEIASHLPELLEQGLALIGQLVAGLIQAIPDVVAAIPKIIDSIVNRFKEQDFGEIGSNIISGIADGLTSGIGKIVSAAKEVARSALDSAKRFLGISSPSKVMRDQVGRFIPEGMADGIKDNTKPLTDAMHDVSDLTANTLQGNLTTQSAAPAVESSTYRNNSFTFNIYAAPGQDEDELAEKLMQRIQFETERKEAAFA